MSKEVSHPVPDQAVACTFIRPEVTERFHPFPIAGRGWIRFSGPGVEFRGFHPAPGLPSAVKGCLALFLIFLPASVLSMVFTDTERLHDLGALLGISLFGSFVGWLRSRRRKAQGDQPQHRRVPWHRIWQIEHQDFRYSTQRDARRGQLRFRAATISPSVQDPEDHDEMMAARLAGRGSSSNFRMIVGHWGRRREVRFETIGPSDNLLQTLQMMKVGG